MYSPRGCPPDSFPVENKVRIQNGRVMRIQESLEVKF